MNVGQYLKRERELRNISLDMVAEISKLSPRYILAIEEGNFDYLPKGAFLKGFIRSYAKAVGLDPVDVILRFDEEVQAAKAAKTPNPKPRGFSFKLPKIRFSGKAVFIIIAILVVILAAIFSSSHFFVH